MLRSSALLFANRKLFSEDNNASEELSESLKEYRKAYKKNKEPDFEVDLNDSKKVAEWAKKYFEYYDLFTYGEANIDFMKDELNEMRHAAQNPYNIKVYQGGAVSPK